MKNNYSQSTLINTFVTINYQLRILGDRKADAEVVNILEKEIDKADDGVFAGMAIDKDSLKAKVVPKPGTYMGGRGVLGHKNSDETCTSTISIRLSVRLSV